MSSELGDEIDGETHLPRCNFWCRDDRHYLLPKSAAHVWVADGRPFMRDRCRVCSGAYHLPS